MGCLERQQLTGGALAVYASATLAKMVLQARRTQQQFPQEPADDSAFQLITAHPEMYQKFGASQFAGCSQGGRHVPGAADTA